MSLLWQICGFGVAVVARAFRNGVAAGVGLGCLLGVTYQGTFTFTAVRCLGRERDIILSLRYIRKSPFGYSLASYIVA